MKAFSITSPTNALAVVVYAMIAFAGFANTVNLSHTVLIDSMPYNESWSMMTFIGGSVAVYATLTAPGRRDPDDSLALELWSSAVLCVLLGLFELFLVFYRSETGAFAVTSFGFGLIFFAGFLARAVQIFVERKNLKAYREKKT